MAISETHAAIEAVYRIERTRLLAGLARMLRDVGQAEELAQDALVAALSEWPKTGIPRNPAAWLMAAAKRRAIDNLRRRKMLERKHVEIGREIESDTTADIEAIETAMDDDIGDERLALIFTACHPLLAAEARVALTLKLIGGLTTGEIARAFLTSEATIAQRIVRAKKALGQAAVGFEVPRGAEMAGRLASVLEVTYLIFNEGYCATAGDDLTRPLLCQEALRLGRILASLIPDEPEVHGLLALMEIQASRLGARVAADGTALMLAEQNRARWDRLLIRRGLDALDRAQSLGGMDGPYALQAALAACHARAARYEDTDWRRIASLYDRLLKVMPSAVVALNRAIAYSMAEGPETGLALLAEIEAVSSLAGYPPLAAAKGDFLLRIGRASEARDAFERAASLSGNAVEKAFLLRRAAESVADRT